MHGIRCLHSHRLFHENKIFIQIEINALYFRLLTVIILVSIEIKKFETQVSDGFLSPTVVVSFFIYMVCFTTL